MKINTILKTELILLCIVPLILFTAISIFRIYPIIDTATSDSYMKTLNNIDTTISLKYNSSKKTIDYLLNDSAMDKFIKSPSFKNASENEHIVSADIAQTIQKYISPDDSITGLVIISPSGGYYTYNYSDPIHSTLSFMIEHGTLNEYSNSYNWINSQSNIKILNSSFFSSGMLIKDGEETLARLYMFIDIQNLFPDSNIKVSIFNQNYSRIFSTEDTQYNALWYYPADISQKIYNNTDKFTSNYNGEPCLFLIQRSSHSPFVFVGMIDYTVSSSLIKSHLSILLFLSVALIITCLMLTKVFSDKVFYPIQLLHEHINELSNANFARISENPYYFTEMNEIISAYNIMSERISQLVYENNSINRQKLYHEIHSLQSQINPHFIYNTLAAIRVKALLFEQNEFAEILKKLSCLLRSTIKKSVSEISMHQELIHQKDYLDIMQYRYDNKINIHYDVDPSVYRSNILCNLVQPILENAIFHGLSQRINKEELARLDITIKKICTTDSPKLYMEIKDNGYGIEQTKIDDILQQQNLDSDSTGLNNVINRIKLMYGNEYGVNINSVPGKFTSVILNLPFIDGSVDNNCD